jgi:branched-chain amino acid transport system substrate-binding protein
MKQKKKFVVGFIVFTTLCMLSMLVGKVYAEDKLKIGVILPLTGEAASVGESVKNGMEIGLEKISLNAREQLEFTYEDDGLAAKNSISAFQKLTSSKKLDVLVNISSGTAKVLSPLAEQNKVSFIAVASDSKVSQGKKYVFNFWITPEEEVSVAIPEALKRGYKKIARIVSLQDGALAIKSAFDKSNNGRLQVVLDEEYVGDVKDFKSYLTKLRTHKDIDAIMVVLLPGQCGIFAKQARQLGIKQDLFGFETFEDSNEVKVSGNALVGQWYVNTDDPDNKFIQEYRKRFPSASLLAASTGNDIVLLLGAAIDRGYKKDNFHEFLSTLNDFSGVLGTYSASGDNRFTIPAVVKVVTKDGFEKVYK